MAVILKGEVSTSAHYCQKELPGKLRYITWGIDDKYRDGINKGLVARCSCGVLWTTRRNSIGLIYWRRAGRLFQWKYRNVGKEIDA